MSDNEGRQVRPNLK